MTDFEIEKSLTEHIDVLRKRSASLPNSDRVAFTKSLVGLARLVMPEASIRKNLETYYVDLLEAAKTAPATDVAAITTSVLLVSELLLEC